MKISTAFVANNQYLISIDGLPIGDEPMDIGEAITIRNWLQNHSDKLQSIYEQKAGWEIIEEMKLWTQTRGEIN